MSLDQPTAPRDSSSHRLLIEEAEAANLDADLLRDMLWLLNAHCHLLGLLTAVKRIQKLLDVAPLTWQCQIAIAGLDAWRPLINWIIGNQQLLSKKIGAHFSRERNTNGNNPILGNGVQRFPVYAVLCEPLPHETQAADKFLKLSGHLLIAQVIALRDHSTRSAYEAWGIEDAWEPLPNHIYPSALAVRRLAEPRHRYRLVDFPIDENPQQFVEYLADLPLPVDDVLAKDQEGLSRLLQKVWQQIEWDERSGGGPGGKGGHKWVGSQLEIDDALYIEPQGLGDEDDTFAAWGAIDIATTRPASHRKRIARLQSDLSPEEDDDDELVLLSDFSCDETKRDFGALARATRAKARHIASSNQQIPWSYEGLAMEEVARLLVEVRQAYEQLVARQTQTESERLLLQTLILIHVMLWTGSDVERAIHARVCSDGNSQAEADLAVVIPAVGEIDRIRWRIRAGSPAYKTDLAGTPSQLRDKKEFLELPDRIGLAPVIRRLVSVKENRTRRDCELFDADEKALKESLQNWLRSYSPEGRVTVTKVAGFLWRRLLETNGDAASVTALTGSMHRLARVRLFYTTPSIARLQEQYARTIDEVKSLAYAAIGKPIPSCDPWLPAELTEGAVGARLCPARAAVKNCFKGLREDIAEAALYVDRPGFIRYHNLFTLYTLQFFAYATTCRAIITPYLPVDKVHPTRGLASLSDKDDETCHKTRLVWIPPSLLDQMLRHQRHQHVLLPQLFHPPRQVIAEPSYFLDESFAPILARPSVIEPLLERYLNVRANTHRRFLRTELVESNCPTEVIDAFLGHWAQGEEPFGDYSSFCFADYVDTLRTHLLPLLEDIGLDRPLSSRLAP